MSSPVRAFGDLDLGRESISRLTQWTSRPGSLLPEFTNARCTQMDFFSALAILLQPHAAARTVVRYLHAQSGLTAMRRSRHTPNFLPKDRRLLDVEAVSRELCVSRAFVRLCLASGYPASGGLLSPAGVLEWLFENYNRVRVAAGFRVFATIDGVSTVAAQRLRMANALFTLFEFSESRATDPEEKRQLRQVQQKIEWVLERC